MNPQTPIGGGKQRIKVADAYQQLRPAARKKLKGLVKQAKKNAKRGRTETLKMKGKVK